MRVLFFAFIFSSVTSFAQDLRSYNSSRVNTTRNAMVVLGGWGVANVAVGLIGASQTSGQTKYFHQMNAIWGAVNLGIATASYFGKRRLDLDYEGSVKEQHKIETIYLVNGGLDVAYIVGGVLLRRDNRDRLKGYGASIIGQGVFLLLYDGVNYTIHRKHGKLLSGLSVTPGGVSMVCSF